jgi:hypothetical protein
VWVLEKVENTKVKKQRELVDLCLETNYGNCSKLLNDEEWISSGSTYDGRSESCRVTSKMRGGDDTVLRGMQAFLAEKQDDFSRRKGNRCVRITMRWCYNLNNIFKRIPPAYLVLTSMHNYGNTRPILLVPRVKLISIEF